MTLRIKRILVPIDFSDVSSLALKYGASFAAEYGAELIILTVGDDDSEWVVDLSDTIKIKDRWREERVIEGGRLIDEFCEEHLNGVAFRKCVRVGNPAEEIVECCRDEAADLLILGAHGTSGVVSDWLGGTAYKVSKSAQCPVLMVKPSAHSLIG